jgi:hypothetical protein
LSWGSGVGPWGGFFFGEAEIAHQISGVVFGGLFGDFEDVWMAGTPEEFVPSGVEVHLGQGGIEIDSLDFIQKLAGGGFLFFL